MFDEVNDGSILRQGASLATNDLFPGDSAQDEYRASDLVPWLLAHGRIERMGRHVRSDIRDWGRPAPSRAQA